MVNAIRMTALFNLWMVTDIVLLTEADVANHPSCSCRRLLTFFTLFTPKTIAMNKFN